MIVLEIEWARNLQVTKAVESELVAPKEIGSLIPVNLKVVEAAVPWVRTL